MLRPHPLKSKAGRRGSSDGFLDKDPIRRHCTRSDEEKGGFSKCRWSRCSGGGGCVDWSGGLAAVVPLWLVFKPDLRLLAEERTCAINMFMCVVSFMLGLQDSVQTEQRSRGLLGCGLPKDEIPMSSVWNIVAP